MFPLKQVAQKYLTRQAAERTEVAIDPGFDLLRLEPPDGEPDSPSGHAKLWMYQG